VSRALEAALFSDPAIALRQVAIELGYANGDGDLSFPELCQALVKRRQESLTKRHQEQGRVTKGPTRESSADLARSRNEAWLQKRQLAANAFPGTRCGDTGESQSVPSEANRPTAGQTTIRADGR
jgi:hypothetical protein